MAFRNARGQFCKAPVAAPAPVVRYNAEANAKALAKAIGNGDFVAVKGKIRAFLTHVQPTTPLEVVIVGMLTEYAAK